PVQRSPCPLGHARSAAPNVNVVSLFRHPRPRWWRRTYGAQRQASRPSEGGASMWIRRNSGSGPAIWLGVVPAMLGVFMVGTARADGIAYASNWQMNETSGPMIDSSGNGNHSSLIEAGVTRTDGATYHFDKGRVEVPSSSTDTPGSRDF